MMGVDGTFTDIFDNFLKELILKAFHLSIDKRPTIEKSEHKYITGYIFIRTEVTKFPIVFTKNH